jgi:apolipoprotein N-acyltransferase
VKSPRRRTYAVRAAALLAGALPVLAFPRVGLDWIAWVALVPGLLIIQAAPNARAGAVRGWWFGAGYLIAALYWTVPNIGPGLLLVGVVFGALWGGWGLAAWRLRHRPVAALVVLPSIWLVIEFIRSWHALGGPWALLGASQWRRPVVLSLAALGGVWLVSFAIVAVNTAVVIALARYRAAAGAAPSSTPSTPSTSSRWAAPLRWGLPLAVPLAIGLAAPVAYGLRGEPPRQRPFTVALVQPGVVHSPAARFAAGERITRGLPPVDLIVWGESSVGFDVDRRPDLTARLTALAARGELLVNEDAKDVRGRISKSSILYGPTGEQGRYVKTRLVPFGEYIPFRSALGWLTKISKAAGQNRVPGTGVRLLRAGDGVTFGPLVCFESAFPDLGRSVVRHGAGMVVYQSATSTFQDSWAPETGRPVVQAALTGVSVAYDARGRRLAWLDTSRRGAVVATLWPAPTGSRTPFDRYGDLVPYFSLAVTVIAVAAFVAGAARGPGAGSTGSTGTSGPGRRTGPSETGGTTGRGDDGSARRSGRGVSGRLRRPRAGVNRFAGRL